MYINCYLTYFKKKEKKYIFDTLTNGERAKEGF